jgi:pyruvate dehydrogenase E1 component alpha subunit
VYDAVSRAAGRARKGAGPSLIEAVTYRWKGHSRSDREAYRTREEVKAWRERDPIPRFADALQAAGMLSDDESEALRAKAAQAIEDALAFAENSPEPDVAEIMDGLYA